MSKIVGAEPLERRFDRRAHGGGRQPLVLDGVSHGAPGLARQDDVLAARTEGAAEDLFRSALVVDVGRVEKIDAGVQAPIDHARGFLEIGLRAERHRAHASTRNLEVGVGDFPLFHVGDYHGDVASTRLRSNQLSPSRQS